MDDENPRFLAFLGINLDQDTPIMPNFNFSKNLPTLIWSTHGVHDFNPLNDSVAPI